MSTAIWPVTLPQEVPKDGYSRKIPNQTIRSDMETGPAKVRYRGGHMPDIVTMTFVLTDAQRDALLTFAKNTVKGAALTFEFPHPEHPTDYVLARFLPVGNDELFSISQYQHSIMWQVTIKLEIWDDVL